MTDVDHQIEAAARRVIVARDAIPIKDLPPPGSPRLPDPPGYLEAWFEAWGDFWESCRALEEALRQADAIESGGARMTGRHKP